MSILFLLIPLSLILLGVAIWAFFWAVDSNQFDDLSGPAYSILYDEDEKATLKAEEQSPQQRSASNAAPESESSSSTSSSDS